MSAEDNMWISLKPGDLIKFGGWTQFYLYQRGNKFGKGYCLVEISGEQIGMFVEEHKTEPGHWRAGTHPFFLKVLIGEQMFYYPSSKKNVDGEKVYHVLPRDGVEKC